MSDSPHPHHTVDCHMVASDAEMLDHLDVRWDVFVLEQDVPMVMEIDGRDYLPSTLHLVAVAQGLDGTDTVVGAARLVADGTDSLGAQFHIGRVAVRQEWRGKGIGVALMQAAEEVALAAAKRESSAQLTLILDAQVAAEGFYARLGYTPTDTPTFYDAGIVHQEMSRHVLL